MAINDLLVSEHSEQEMHEMYFYLCGLYYRFRFTVHTFLEI